MKVVPFQAEHFWAMDVQPAQARVRAHATPEEIASLEKHDAFTALVGDNPVMCFGWVPVYEHRAIVWALIAASAGPHFVGLTRIAKTVVNGLAFRRLEMEVDCEFEQGHRWAKMLGFELEAERLRGHRMDGGDSSIYARVAQWM